MSFPCSGKRCSAKKQGMCYDVNANANNNFAINRSKFNGNPNVIHKGKHKSTSNFYNGDLQLFVFW